MSLGVGPDSDRGFFGDLFQTLPVSRKSPTLGSTLGSVDRPRDPSNSKKNLRCLIDCGHLQVSLSECLQNAAFSEASDARLAQGNSGILRSHSSIHTATENNFPNVIHSWRNSSHLNTSILCSNYSNHRTQHGRCVSQKGLGMGNHNHSCKSISIFALYSEWFNYHA